ncbi:MAG TPA: non-heme iron oxygenase ferredoxin subunit [Candidatus Nitrosotenuis sp.]|nr:non-heme iron oxygenase ferredoxin subunit [Candidatus Nitrosotenuis sp.]
MSQWIDVLEAGKLQPGDCTSVTLPDGREIALYNVGGEVFATDNVCLHQGGPLGEGYLEGDCVTCPWHGWQYNVKTGECLEVPGEKVASFPARILDGKIQVQI